MASWGLLPMSYEACHCKSTSMYLVVRIQVNQNCLLLRAWVGLNDLEGPFQPDNSDSDSCVTVNFNKDTATTVESQILGSHIHLDKKQMPLYPPN